MILILFTAWSLGHASALPRLDGFINCALHLTTSRDVDLQRAEFVFPPGATRDLARVGLDADEMRGRLRDSPRTPIEIKAINGCPQFVTLLGVNDRWAMDLRVEFHLAESGQLLLGKIGDFATTGGQRFALKSDCRSIDFRAGRVTLSRAAVRQLAGRRIFPPAILRILDSPLEAPRARADRPDVKFVFGIVHHDKAVGAAFVEDSEHDSLHVFDARVLNGQTFQRTRNLLGLEFVDPVPHFARPSEGLFRGLWISCDFEILRTILDRNGISRAEVEHGLRAVESYAVAPEDADRLTTIVRLAPHRYLKIVFVLDEGTVRLVTAFSVSYEKYARFVSGPRRTILRM